MSASVLDIFIYPVSGVMKLWHLLLHDAFGMDDSRAWLISIFGLVLTVRALITPLYWMQIRSARLNVLMRPEKAALNERYAKATDKESVAAHEQAVKDLHKRYGYRAAAGCFPMLIQIPTFLGLYQVLLRMARPDNGFEVPADARIGFLNADEISAFLDARVGGVPLPAYIAMPPESLAALGTTSGEVRNFILPFLLAAVAFTTVNMVWSIFRNIQTLDWDSGLARGLQKFIIVLTIGVPILLLWLGLAGPVPVAVILYWFANNLWTLAQSTIGQFQLARTLPLQEEHLAYRDERRDAVLQEVRAKRDRKRYLHRRRVQGLVQPGKIGEIRRELAADRVDRQETKAADKAERKKLRKARAVARTELNREKMARRRAEREARRKESDSDVSGSTASTADAADLPDPGPGAERADRQIE